MSTRCSNNYGTHQFPEKAIPLFVTNLFDGRQIPLYGSGEHRRDWLHVLDHCRAIDIVIRHGEPGRSYNVGGGTELSNRELVAQLLSLMSRTWSDVETVPDRPGHDQRYSVDDSRLRRLGYSPRVPFDAGLAETVAWYLAHEEWWRPLMTGPQISRVSA